MIKKLVLFLLISNSFSALTHTEKQVEYPVTAACIAKEVEQANDKQIIREIRQFCRNKEYQKLIVIPMRKS